MSHTWSVQSSLVKHTVSLSNRLLRDESVIVDWTVNRCQDRYVWRANMTTSPVFLPLIGKCEAQIGYSTRLNAFKGTHFSTLKQRKRRFKMAAVIHRYRQGDRCGDIYCDFKCTFLSLEPMCQRKMFIFTLCIFMNSKDLFDWIGLGHWVTNICYDCSELWTWTVVTRRQVVMTLPQLLTQSVCFCLHIP